MKILFDYQAFSLQRYGGISRYFINLYRGFESGGIDCSLNMLYSENYYLNELRAEHNRNLLKGFFKNRVKRYSRWNKRYALAILPFTEFDIFHPTYYDPYFIKKVRKPVVVTVHDMIHEKFPQLFTDAQQIIADKKKVIERADAVICISNATKKDLLDIYPVYAGKVHVVHHGYFDKTQTSQTLHHKLNLPANYLLFVGERWHYKNFINLILGVKNILNKYPDLHLICVGGGSFSNSEISLLAENAITSQCYQVTADENLLNILYQNAKAFVFPSLDEGFGLPVLEAFAAGCPVIMSNTNVFKEVGGHAALYFDPNDNEDIEDKISQVLFSTNQQACMKEKGKERLKQFSATRCIEQTIQVYKTLI